MLKLNWTGKTQKPFSKFKRLRMRIPRAHAWPTFFTHRSSLFFSLQVVSKRFSSKNKFTGLICKTATPFVQVWHSKELQKCLLFSLWNAFRKKIFNFYSLMKQFFCFYSAGWVQKKKESQIKNNASPTLKCTLKATQSKLSRTMVQNIFSLLTQISLQNSF